jgi:hypothetical protein
MGGMRTLRYEAEVRQLVNSPERAREVRALRTELEGTWRFVGERCQEAWDTSVGINDAQSFGETLCHVAAEVLGENPDADPWN